MARRDDVRLGEPVEPRGAARAVVGDEVVGASRVATPEKARRLGTYYAETEFDLTRPQLLRDDICNRSYRFSAEDVAELFAASEGANLH